MPDSVDTGGGEGCRQAKITQSFIGSESGCIYSRRYGWRERQHGRVLSTRGRACGEGFTSLRLRIAYCNFNTYGARAVLREVLAGVEVGNTEVIPARACVLALGPWTTVARGWLPQLPTVTSALKAHSILMKPTDPCPPNCLFLSFRSRKGKFCAFTRIPTRPCPPSGAKRIVSGRSSSAATPGLPLCLRDTPWCLQ